jgi:PKD repeat protein
MSGGHGQRWYGGVLVCAALALAGCGGGGRKLPTPNPLNQAPHARLTVRVSNGESPWTVTFDGSASTDSDGHIVSYEWDFDDNGAVDSATTSPVVERLTSDSGRFTAKLTVVDDDGGVDQATGSYLVGSGGGWQVVTVDTLGGGAPLADTAGARTALAVVNGNPAISYGGDTLHYARASTPTGSAAADWSGKAQIASDSGTGTQQVQAQQMAIVDGSPAICFTNTKLFFVRSVSTDGLQTGDWDAIVLRANGPVRAAALATVDGNPAIAYVQAGDAASPPTYSGDTLGFFHAATSDGTSPDEWQNPVALQAADPAVGYGGLSLQNIAGTPALACVQYQTDSASHLRTVSLQYAACASADGLTATDWTFAPVLQRQFHSGDSVAVDIGRPALQYIDGMPALACLIKSWSLASDSVTVNELDELLYDRLVPPAASASRAVSAASATWTPLTLDTVERSFTLSAAGAPVLLPASAPDLQTIGINPAIAYPPAYAASDTQDGAALKDWQKQDVEAGYGVSLAEVGGNPALSYFLVPPAGGGAGPVK